jgi:soluble lytic murein transglycosylase-like protein
MIKPHPKQVIFPAILLAAGLLLLISHAVYGSTHHQQDIAIKAGSSSIVDDFISLSFPQSIKQWDSEIQIAAQETGLDPNLIASVMLLESGGQSQVISSSGAVGLMQVMPRDGIAASFSCINGPCFQDRPSISELKDPNFNIIYGSRFLAGLISNHGSLRAALRAYGPMDAGFSYADKVLAIYHAYD